MGMIMKILQIILYSIILDVNISLSEPDRHCLDCICQASSGCKRNIQCHNNGNGQYYCGPYQISWAYWADAGKPGDAGFANDFEQCLVKKSCSEAAVRGYMKKYGNDCNGDGHVDCLDYAAIHKAGPSGSCQPSWLLESKYWLEFQQCYSHSSSSSLTTEASFRDDSNSPYNTMIEIPRNKPPFLPPLPPPLILPPIHARASASVPGASASASATAGFDSNNGNPLTVASTSIGNGNDEIGTEIVETYPPLPSPPRRLGSLNRSNQIPPIPGVFVNKPQPSSPVLVPSANFNRIKPIRFNFQNSPSPSIRREDYSPAINSVSNVEEPEEIVVSEAQELIPYDCLQCLCHASSKCDLNKGCDGAYCGPYLLSWGYWADGGKPGGEYATCSKQKPCSETAIQGYMAKWKRDCNHDGTIDCIDFALIHKLGPHGCEKIQALQSTDYWNQFSQCHQTESGNKPARSTRPVLVEVPRPQPIISTRSSEPFIRPSPNSNEDESNIEQPQPRGVVIRVNNRDLINTNNNHLRSPPPPRPPTRIDLGTLNTSQPIIIRIKPPINSNDPSRINIPEIRPRPPTLQPKPVEIIEEPPAIIEPRRPVISDNDDFFSQPRPLDQPSSSHNEQPNVSEIPRQPSPLPPSPPRPKPPSRQNTTTNNLVTVECLECICYASSKCNPSIGCRSEGTGKYVCGSYQVDWEYWMEAGKPGNRADLSNVENFQMCMNNRECADKTVTEYLKRFRKDCNEDGHIDCNDYAALHIGGPKHCGAQWYLDSKYYSDFRECFDF